MRYSGVPAVRCLVRCRPGGWSHQLRAFKTVLESLQPSAPAPSENSMRCKCVQVPCRSCNPLDIQQLAFPGDLWFVLVNPVFEAPTAEMRAVLPKQVAMSSAIHNCAMGGSLVCPPSLPD